MAAAHTIISLIFPPAAPSSAPPRPPAAARGDIARAAATGGGAVDEFVGARRERAVRTSAKSRARGMESAKQI